MVGFGLGTTPSNAPGVGLLLAGSRNVGDLTWTTACKSNTLPAVLSLWPQVLVLEALPAVCSGITLCLGITPAGDGGPHGVTGDGTWVCCLQGKHSAVVLVWSLSRLETDLLPLHILFMLSLRRSWVKALCLRRAVQTYLWLNGQIEVPRIWSVLFVFSQE